MYIYIYISIYFMYVYIYIYILQINFNSPLSDFRWGSAGGVLAQSVLHPLRRLGPTELRSAKGG